MVQYGRCAQTVMAEKMASAHHAPTPPRFPTPPQARRRPLLGRAPSKGECPLEVGIRLRRKGLVWVKEDGKVAVTSG
jgi:hypothetical protein